MTKLTAQPAVRIQEGGILHTVEVEWFNESMIGNVSGVSKSNIIQGLEGGENGLGSYTLELSVTAETGGGLDVHTQMRAKT